MPTVSAPDDYITENYPIPLIPTLHRNKLLWIILHLDSANLFYLMSFDILPSPYQELADF